MSKIYVQIIQRIRTSIALTLCVGLALLAHVPLLTSAGANSVLPAETAEITRVRMQAAEYARAMGVIAALGTTPIRTKEDAIRTVESIKNLDSALKVGLLKRLTLIALDNRTFRLAIEQETTRLGPKVFYERVTANPSMVSTLRGVSEVKLAMTRRLQADAATLKTTAAYLKRAAATHGQANQGFSLIRANYVEGDEAIEPTLSPQTGVGETLIIAAVVAAVVLLIGSYAAILSKGHEVPPATEDNPNPISPVAKCLNEAQERRDRCLAQGDFWADLACAAVYLLDRADCLLLPQA